MYEIEKIDMRVKYTREWTFEALCKLLEHKKYSEIKISEIIVKAGISRATFYRNFSTKDDIIKIRVKTFFHDFYLEVAEYYKKNRPENEQFLITSFFKRFDEENRLIDTVIKSNSEYMMIEGLLELIKTHNEMFYPIVKTTKRTEDYTMEIVASSTWTLISRWHKSGKIETSSELSKIYLRAFKNVYQALFLDKSQIGE